MNKYRSGKTNFFFSIAIFIDPLFLQRAFDFIAAVYTYDIFLFFVLIKISNGNIAVCIFDEKGGVHGKMFGTNKPRLRQSYKVACTKAIQAWLFSVKTGAYDRIVFDKEVEKTQMV